MSQILAYLDLDELYELRKLKAKLWSMSLRPEDYDKQEREEAYIDNEIFIKGLVDKYNIDPSKEWAMSVTLGCITEETYPYE